MWVIEVVVCLVVLGGLAYGLVGALGRLRREIEGAEGDLRPVLQQMQAAAARATEVSQRRTTTS